MAAWSGLWDHEFGSAHTLLSNRTGNAETALSRVFGKSKSYSRAVTRELLYELLGAAAGQTALTTHKRVQAVQDLSANVMGGVRPIETFTGINRATTSADRTALRAALELTAKPTSYATDRAGVGGGGKLGW